jgi:hypothetical protein
MEFLLLFLQPEGSSYCSGLARNCKLIQTEMFEVKGKYVQIAIFASHMLSEVSQKLREK